MTNVKKEKRKKAKIVQENRIWCYSLSLTPTPTARNFNADSVSSHL